MAVDRAIADRDAIGIGLVHQLSRVLTTPGPPHERLQQQELGHRQRHRASVPGAASRSGSSVSAPTTSAASSSLRGPVVDGGARAQQHFDARHQLAHRERLAQVVVGANLEAEHAIELLFARRHEDDRQRLRARAQPAAQLQAVDAAAGRCRGSTRSGSARSKRLPRRRPSSNASVAIAFAAQRDAHRFADRLFVFDDRTSRPRGRSSPFDCIAQRRGQRLLRLPLFRHNVPPCFLGPPSQRIVAADITRGSRCVQRTIEGRTDADVGNGTVGRHGCSDARLDDSPDDGADAVVSERATRRDAAVAEVGGIWGGAQTIGGPVLTLPYRYTWIGEDGRPVGDRARLFPSEALEIEGTVEPELRRRGLFEVVVYKAHLNSRDVSRGRTSRESVRRRQQILWDEATLSLGVADPRGISRRVTVMWNGREEAFVPGVD